MRRYLAFSAAALVSAATWSAAAQDSSGGTSGGFSLSTDDGFSSSGSGGAWMDQYKPVPDQLELGLYLGALFPSSDHNFHEEKNEQRELSSFAPGVGLRAAYFPKQEFVGGELEGGVYSSSDESALLWTMRAHLIGQLPFWRVTPFAVLGGGRMGISSDSLGSDGDPLLHFGIGAKAAVTRVLDLRVDLRDNLTQKNQSSDGTLTHHPEFLVGLSFVLGREDEAPLPPKDSDGDGVVDGSDQCPDQPGPAPTGCPPPPDTDGDGVLDSDDQCPQQAGPAPSGCPAPADTDGDGITDDQDKCPTEKGPKPDGCPNEDPDGDGFVGEADKCPQKPETKNGFEDTDGCPDEVPEEVAAFTGVIPGIEFDFGKATIRPASKPILDGAALVLTNFPALRIKILGHTDDVGKREDNIDLSKKRAEAVKAYLVSKNIKADRIETEGLGPDKPIASNDTPAGRQRNRRIEFQLIQ